MVLRLLVGFYMPVYIFYFSSQVYMYVWIFSGVKTEPSPEAEVEEELEVDELYEELPEEPVAVRRRSEGQNNSRASKAVSLMYVTVVSLFSIIFFFNSMLKLKVTKKYFHLCTCTFINVN